jgi:branched-chain amino acid transport system permease protein
MKTSRSLLWLVGALLLGGSIPQWLSSATVLSLLSQAIIYAIFALGVGLLLKQNGMVSFGHALYFGGAAYLVGMALQLPGMSPEWAILAVLLLVFAAALLIGLVIVRVPGVAFGMLTLAIGQMFYLSASRARGVTGGADGMNIDWPSQLFGMSVSQLLKPASLFVLTWSVLVLMIWGLNRLLHTRFGAITEAVRDNEERARFIGLSTLWPRAVVYAVSALVTAVAGVLSALNTGFVSPENLHWSLSGVALMMVVVGGFKAVWGPAVGAVVYFLFKDLLGEHATHWMTIFGLALIAVIVFSPTGMAGLITRLIERFQRAPQAQGDRS